MKFIPYGAQYIDKKDINSVKKVLKKDIITGGSEVIKFEKKINKKENELLNLDKIILYLEKNQKKLIFLNKLFLYFTRYFVSKDIYSHWKL